jgi:ATP adenylyltransferase
MRHLFAPWRAEYINQPKPGRCIFCAYGRQKRDERNLILYRGRTAFVIMNRFPYNNGHLMIAPFRHVGEVGQLKPAELRELFALLPRVTAALTREFRPAGFNVGLNLGRVAGAGIARHLHVHVVPRWNGDTNFMPVAGRTKVVSEALATTYSRLRLKIRRVGVRES